jgi:ADP-ribosylglycohydrolase
MAIAITEVLEEHGEIRQESLAESFGKNFLADHQRGYGAAMHTLLPELASAPSAWKTIAPALFKGEGSFGNGAAMRVAPLGAYFADDFDKLIEQAELSAVITHSHPEGVAGAIAVALAAALAWRHKSAPTNPRDFLQKVSERTPESEVRRGLIEALGLPTGTAVERAATLLGNGSKINAQDTVPFALWAAAHHLDDYQDALWATVIGLGDRDTNCAIVGGIAAMSAGIESIPLSWIHSREPLPASCPYPEPQN